MTDDHPLVSILIPAYNAAPYLRELCFSIQAQTYPHFEVLIGDDGSTDNTRDAVTCFLPDRRFRFLRWDKNRGVHAATNALFAGARGQYWCYPGADDLLAPTFLEQRLELMERNPHAVIAHGPPEVIDETGRALPNVSLQPDSPVELPADRALRVILQHNIINTPSVMVRSHLTHRILPFFQGDWRYAQDWFLWILHLSTGCDLLWDSRPLHKYRIHRASLTHHPAKTAVRQAEIRLVPLCALSTAARFSLGAACCWLQWKAALYCLWLRRALRLRARRELQDEWRQVGLTAYYGGSARPSSLLAQVVGHSLGILQAAAKESRARKQQTFAVSGLAQINDPIFR